MVISLLLVFVIEYLRGSGCGRVEILNIILQVSEISKGRVSGLYLGSGKMKNQVLFCDDI